MNVWINDYIRMIIHSSMEYLRTYNALILTFYFNWHLQKFRNKTDINDILSLMLIIDHIYWRKYAVGE